MMIFAFRFRRPDNGELMQCNCALVETLWPYGSPKGKSSRKSWWQSTAQIGTKLLYLPSEDTDKVVYVVPLCDILGKLPLVPAGATGTIPKRERPAGYALSAWILRHHWKTWIWKRPFLHQFMGHDMAHRPSGAVSDCRDAHRRR